jgi:translation initiation factor 2 beta subunit (eIF-2beta)/eIF-5
MIMIVDLSTTTMMVKCRDCGHEHPSIIQMDTSDFKTAMLQEKREHCSKCGSVSTYKKSDYFFL